MTGATRAHLLEFGIGDPRIVGIHSGGVWLAEHLRTALGLTEGIGTLDISFYRDDFTRVGMNPTVRPSRIPWDVEGRHLILVDDVLYTGRTIRAALNELFDYGRPASVTLVVLVSRNGRELPRKRGRRKIEVLPGAGMIARAGSHQRQIEMSGKQQRVQVRRGFGNAVRGFRLQG